MNFEESKLGWLRLGASLGEVRFSLGHRPGGIGGDQSDVKGTPKTETRYGATLHQNYCGHGYAPEPQHSWNGVLHRHARASSGDSLHNYHSTSLMGASPSEWSRRWAFKDRYRTFSKK